MSVTGAAGPFDWDQERYDEFRRKFAQLQGEGEIDPDLTRSDALRAILEDWLEDPDPTVMK